MYHSNPSDILLSKIQPWDPKKESSPAANLLAAGLLLFIVTGLTPLEQVNDGLNRLRTGQVLCRLVLQIPGRE